jgi:hypothetical protein
MSTCIRGEDLGNTRISTDYAPRTLFKIEPKLDFQFLELEGVFFEMKIVQI